MKLYHGSKENFTSIKPHKAGKADHIEVPKDELLDAIYLTGDFSYALMNAIKPMGVTRVDNENKIIIFENPNLFDPEKEVFMYEVDISHIPKENIVKVDDYQYAIINTEEIAILKKTSYKSSEILKYYKLENWSEKQKQKGTDFKMR